MKYKIVIADYYYPNLDAEFREFARLGGDVDVVDLTKVVPGGIKNPRELEKYTVDCDALIVQFANVDKRLIETMQQCKIISRYAIGVDTIDLEAAHSLGIFVSNVPDYCINEVANNAAAHILNAIRKITVARDLLLQGSFDMNAIRPVFRTENRTLCLLGFGNIARNLYAKMKPFFKEVVAYDPFFNHTADYPDVRFLPLDDALRCADVISIHVPLNPKTRGMISDRAFGLMKDGVILVNTARGDLIDEAAMQRALDSGKLGFVGTDVLETEDFASSPFLHHPRVALTPHIGWCSEEALAELQQKVAANVVECLLNGKPVYSV